MATTDYIQLGNGRYTRALRECDREWDRFLTDKALDLQEKTPRGSREKAFEVTEQAIKEGRHSLVECPLCHGCGLTPYMFEHGLCDYFEGFGQVWVSRKTKGKLEKVSRDPYRKVMVCSDCNNTLFIEKLDSCSGPSRICRTCAKESLDELYEEIKSF